MTTQRVRGTLIAILVILPVARCGADEAHHIVRFGINSGVGEKARTMCFSPDSTTLAISVSDGVSLIQCETGREIARYSLKPFSMAYSRDGSRILMISENGTHLVDARQLRGLPYQLTCEPGDVGISLESRHGRLLVVDLQHSSPAKNSGKISVGDEIIAIAEGRDGREKRLLGRDVPTATSLLAGAAGTHVTLRLMPKDSLHERLVVLPRHERLRSPTGTQFIPFNTQATGEALVWCMLQGRHALVDASTGKITTIIESHQVRQIGQYAVSPDGKTFAIMANNRQSRHSGIEIFDLVTQADPGYVPFPDRSWKQVAFNDDSSRLLVLSNDTIEILNVNTRTFLPSLGLRPEPSLPRVNRSSHSLTGAAARSTHDSVADGDEKHDTPTTMAVCGSKIVACGNQAGTVTIWNFSEHSRQATLTFGPGAIELIQCSRDGKWLAVFEDSTLHLLHDPARRESGAP